MSRRTALWTALGLVLLLCSGCAGLKPAPAPTAPAAAEPAVRVQVVAPETARKLLEQHLDLTRLVQLQGDEAPDEAEWVRLIGAAPAQVRDLLQTEGWFSPVVKVERSGSLAGGTAAEPGKTGLVTVQVDTGPRVQVAGLTLGIDGPLDERRRSGDADARALSAQIEQQLPLQPGRPFRNADWSETKQVLLARLRAAGYASARLQASRADIDTVTGLAQLTITLASGPLYLAGPILIEGLVHHDAETVRHLAGFGAGTPLTEARLLDYQDRLQKAGLFERASVSYDPDEARAGQTPVRVAVGELPLQQATVGVGLSANTGPRASLEHTHRRPFGWAVTAYNKLEWGRDSQSWTGDFYTHPGEGFYRNLLGAQFSRVKGTSDVVLSQRLRLGRTQDTQRIERLYFAELLRSRLSNTSGVTSATAVSGNYHLVWRNLDSVVLPTRGVSVSLQGGLGRTFHNTDGAGGPFGRVYGRFTGYLPVADRWYLEARLEAGQVIKRDTVQVPDALGFRAGGDDSVRGYGYRDLAPTAADGTVRSGMVLLTGSVELARPVSPQLPSVWWAVFADAGRAADRWQGFTAAAGYGVGVRWRSPIGPLRADLAWGEELHRMRLHLSVGIAF